MSAPPKSGMSLYANLMGERQKAEQAATISGAPVRYSAAKPEEKKAADASLQKFQPIRRPQPKTKTNRHQLSSSTTTASAVTVSSPDKQLPPTTTSSTPQQQQQPNVQRTKLEDWVGDEEDGYRYQENRPKPERGGRKKKKKGKQQQETRVWDWDDIYDPTLPNNYADYKNSEEQYREIRDWKARLYYHQLKEAKKEGKNGMAMAAAISDDEQYASKPANRMFAPPPNLNFAPPPNLNFAPPPNLNFAPPSLDSAPRRPSPARDDDDYYPPSVPSYPPNTSDSYERPPAFAQASVPEAPTGDDAYIRRMHLGGAMPAQPLMPVAQPQQAPRPAMPAPTPAAQVPAGSDKAAADIAAKKAEAAAKIAAFKAKIASAAKPGNGAAALPAPPAPPNAPQLAPVQPASSPPTQVAPPPPPPEEPGISVSRAPVRYQIPPPSDFPADTDNASPAPEAAEPTRSNRPGQKGFAERLLRKYGWEKGQGLGAAGEGITTAIVAKAEKRKKRSDAEGGGWAQPANMGRLFGGKKRKIDNTGQDDGHFGAMSEVIKLEGMCKGMEDIDAEINKPEGGLYDEIGGEMEAQYGKVERIVVWRQEQGGNDDVFVKFTSQLSALRAVNATDGMEFNGQAVRARFFEAERFERGEYA
ncbi:hypothetical protein LTR36_005077 [Oleoguttula mirabilis]|uniref:G-patch domain-containing protein n=1 Tax=Oleoguttula mirabilis TaxID=1507867 RepID=A0AAV9JWR1_9PEZI|nr:hypothetical protein LTR36_005077 [Oleoguttula mirabilis]